MSARALHTVLLALSSLDWPQPAITTAAQARASKGVDRLMARPSHHPRRGRNRAGASTCGDARTRGSGVLPPLPRRGRPRDDRRTSPRERIAMSSLVAIAYDDVATAEEVRGVLAQASKEQLITLDDAVVVSRDANGKVKLHQAVSMSGAGAAGGALWGGLIGLLFLAPLLGMAVGAAAGAAGGAEAGARGDGKVMKGPRGQAETGGRGLYPAACYHT